MTEIKVVHDEEFDNSHEEEFGTFVAGHPRRNLGMLNGKEGERFMEDLDESALKIPIYAYEHGGIALSAEPFGCQWDSGQVGWWVFTSEDLVKIYNEDTEETRSNATEGVDAAIKYLNDVYSGNVWGYKIIDFDGGIADSGWGFVGDDAPIEMKEELPENLHTSLDDAWKARFS